MIAEIKKIYDDPSTGYMNVEVIEPRIKTTGPYQIVEKANMSVVVYDKDGRFKEVVERVVRPRKSFGAWAVWAIKYNGKTYTSMSDEIYGFLTIVKE